MIDTCYLEHLAKKYANNENLYGYHFYNNQQYAKFYIVLFILNTENNRVELKYISLSTIPNNFEQKQIEAEYFESELLKILEEKFPNSIQIKYEIAGHICVNLEKIFRNPAQLSYYDGYYPGDIGIFADADQGKTYFFKFSYLDYEELKKYFKYFSIDTIKEILNIARIDVKIYPSCSYENLEKLIKTLPEADQLLLQLGE